MQGDGARLRTWAFCFGIQACEGRARVANLGALIIRIGFGGPLYYNYNIGNDLGPILFDYKLLVRAT